MLRTVAGLSSAGLGLALTAPSRVLRGTGAAAGLAAEVAGLGAQAAAAGAGSVGGAAVRAGRVACAALAVGGEHRRAGSRLRLRMRPRLAGRRKATDAARAVALALAEHPDVLFAYWDEGLERLVVQLVEDAASERIIRGACALAAERGLAHVAEDATQVEPSSGVGDVRTAATALAVDAAGAATAVVGRLLRLKAPPRMAMAATALAREDPRIKDLVRRRFGRSGADVLLAAANAVTHSIGCSPTPLLLDAALRASQLVEAMARAAAYDDANDALCAPDRMAAQGDRPAARPEPDRPAEGYAATAVTGGVMAAGAALLTGRGGDHAAAAALAGAPKAAGYGPAAYAAGVGIALARAGVLVRDLERLPLLERVDTIVLHPSALRGAGEDRELDPLAEAVLDAARRAGLRVILGDDPSLGDFAALADDVVDADQPLVETVRRLQDDNHVVLTVARVPGGDPAGATSPDDATEVLRGLLRGDLAVSVADRGDAVLWGADVVSMPGLMGVWRILTAVPGARTVWRNSKILAEAGTALSGLLLVAGGRSRRGWMACLPFDPVNLAAAGALFSGWHRALRVSTAAAPAPRRRVPWHALEPEDVRARLDRSPPAPDSALATATGWARELARTTAGHPAFAPVRWSTRLLIAMGAELHDPFTPVLAVGAAASAILGSPVDAALVGGAMGINALVGGVQRVRAETALSALATGQSRKARRVDDHGASSLVAAADLKVGDTIALEPGDVVPADARLLEMTDLEVDESPVTGESLPVAKRLGATPGAPVAERRCMVFEGTTVVAGQARALVVGTGAQTVAGRAISLAARTPQAPGVEARLRELTGRALPLTLVGGAAVTGLSLLRGGSVREAVRGGVAVAVASVPEGLPLVATVAQLAAARRLGTRGVLVRAPRALEAMGRVDTMCFDKTGTLTENRLRVVRCVTSDGASHRPDEPGARAVMRTAGRTCPDENGHSAHSHHSTDEAILRAAPPDPGWRQLHGQPFEAGRGYAAATGTAADAGGRTVLAVKGAPEVVLKSCSDRTSDVMSMADDLAGQGLRVLAVARRELGPDDEGGPVDELAEGLEFLGFLCLADSPRQSSPELVAGLREAGVRPVMLTGDHPSTARAIAEDLGWPTDFTIVTGDELAALDGAARARVLTDAGVVARVAPEQKMQVIEALRAAGRVVAMIGDGANDAAAIRAADVGIGVAARGSAAARGAADLVLTNGEFTVLVDAVAEGRALWRSAADAVSILVGGNAGEVGFSMLGTLASGVSPLSTRQLLLVNLLTDMFPAMAVAVTPGQASTKLGAAGAHRAEAALGTPLTDQIRHRAVTTGVGAATAWLIGTLTPGSARRTSTMSLCGLVGTQLAQTMAGRLHSPLVIATSLGSAAVLAGIVQTPGISHFFGCTPLGPLAWAGVTTAIGTATIGPRIGPRVWGTRDHQDSQGEA